MIRQCYIPSHTECAEHVALPYPCLLLPCSDADLSLAASSIIKGGFSYSGQRCTAVKVVLVMADVADELVKMVSSKGAACASLQ